MDLRESIRSQTPVGLSIAKRLLSKEGEGKNVVFSPLSIHLLLSLVTAGSEGPVRDQLLSFLGSESTNHLNSLASQLLKLVLADASSSRGPRLSFANGIWLDKSFSPRFSFKQLVDTTYKATLASLDFQNKVEVANEVNSWAEKETNGLIKDVLSPGSVESSSKVILANALYFKGAWKETFNASRTFDYDFYLLNGTSVEVPFMTSKKKQFISAFDGFKVLGLPYKQGEDDERHFSMYLFLPDARDGLPPLVDKVCSESAACLESKLPRQRVEVGCFMIPRFKISFGVEACPALKELGLVLPFSGGGLTEMVDSPVGQSLHVSSIFHKSVIEVNEVGTEAAVVSVAMVTTSCWRPAKVEIDFVADHPFLFMIREDMTGTVLFIGQVLNPLAG